MGDRVVNEFVALFVFLKRAVQGGGKGKREGKEERGKKTCGGEEKRGLLVTDLCRHLTVQI
jgi:hypothetical protein